MNRMIFKEKFNIDRLINILSQPISLPDSGSKVSSNNKYATTLRLDPVTKYFFEQKAEQLGISLQETISMILRAVMLDSTRESSLVISASAVHKIAERFLSVFNDHDIPLFDVPKLFPAAKMDLSAFASPELFLKQIDDSVINRIQKIFFINDKWLKGLDVPPVICDISSFISLYSFSHLIKTIKYGSYFSFGQEREQTAPFEDITPKRFKLYYCHKSEKGFSFELLRRAAELEDKFERQDLCIALGIEASINKVKFQRYIISGPIAWNFSSARYSLKSLARLAQKWGIEIITGAMNPDLFDVFAEGEAVPASLLKNDFRYSSFSFTDYLEETPFNPEIEEVAKVADFFTEKGYDKLKNPFAKSK